ncbi:MAG: sugar phosphate isomerase/epimerase [Phycisphaeraceae bacterium]|nr:sugar phosphate isomerase/epimerase [Phycisphaeraceae bacterium]
MRQTGATAATILITMAYLATIASFGFSDFDPPSLLAVYKDLGCVALQYYRNEANPPKLEEVLRVGDDLCMRYDSIHGAFGSNYDPSSTDEAFRKKSIAVYRQEAETALKLGGPKIVVHPGAPSADGKIVSYQVQQQRLAPLTQSLHELAEMGQELGVTYLIENLPGIYYAGTDPAALAEMIRKVNSPHLKMCFDTGHAHMTCDVVDHFKQCVDVIDYMHVSVNNKRFDSHLIPGHGTIPWEALGHELKNFQGAAMLEVFFSLGMMQREADAGLASTLKQFLQTD